jgi:dipeptidyl aminopeptidase/acylaminoacyl peptidase
MKSKFLIVSLLIIFAFIITSLTAGEVNRVEIGNLVLEDVPGIPMELSERLLQYQNVRSAIFRDWDAKSDGILIGTRFGETYQFHVVQKPLGMRKQLTFFNEPVFGGTFSRDKETYGFLFTKDIGGSEFSQIFYFDMNTGRYTMLTDGESRNGAANWSNKGDRFTYYSTKRNGRDWDVYIGNIDNPDNAECVLEKNGVWLSYDWFPDDSKLLITNYISANESYFYTLDLKTKELEQINPSEEKIAYGGAIFSKDGKGVYLTSDENAEFQRLRYYDLKSKKSKILTKDIPWDVNDFTLSDNGNYLAYIVNDDGISKLHMLDLASNKDIKLPDIPIGQVYGISFSPDSKRFSMVLNTPTSPGDIYILDIKSKKLERWTESEVGGLNTDNFIEPELIHYPTFDEVDGKSRMIPAFIYKPKIKKGPFPVVIDIHGGPEGQEQPYFSSTTQLWLNELGIALITPNVRGSSGYGKSYLVLDNGYKREDSVKDIGKLLDWIAEQSDLNKDRVAVYGGSYGGYMVLSSMTHYNDRLTCGVDVVGISNFVTFLQNTKEYRQDLRRVEYGDERDPEMAEFLNRISPTTNAHKITKPLFVVQGLNDPRVPASEAEQIVAKIRENGGDVWYMLAKDEGHGYQKKSNRDHYNAAVVMFFEKYLLK